MKGQFVIPAVLIILLSVIIALLLFAYLFGVFSTTSKTTLQPIPINNFQVFNYQQNPQVSSQCGFSFSLISVPNINFATDNIAFTTSSGISILPSYKNMIEEKSMLTGNEELYTFVPNANSTFINYGTNICKFISNGMTENEYITGITRISNNRLVAQSFVSSEVFSVDSPDTTPSSLLGKNIISVEATNNYGYVLVKGFNSSINIFAAVGEYLYLPIGKYSIEYVPGNPQIIFLEWNYSGGAIIQNITDQTTNITIINNGGIKIDNFLTTAPISKFVILSNKTTTGIGEEIKVSAASPQTGYYTFYANGLPIVGCINTNNYYCVFTETTSGSYNVTSSFKSQNSYQESNILTIKFYSKLSINIINLNFTSTQNYVSVNLASNNTTFNCYSSCSYLTSGTVTLTAYNISANSFFNSYTGSGANSYSGTNKQISINSNQNITETTFFINKYPLIIKQNATSDYSIGYATILFENNNTQETCSVPICSYLVPSGTNVKITAYGNDFSSYTGFGTNSYTGTSNPITVKIINSITETINYFQLYITFYNNQNSATPSPFQQYIELNSSIMSEYNISYSGSSINFYFEQNGVPIPAWIQNYANGNLYIWLKLPNGIPASSSVTINIIKTSANSFTNSNDQIGEAPLLSPSYAEYDNGNNVFNQYWNFNGTSLPTTFGTWNDCPGSYLSVKNSLIISNGNCGANDGLGIYFKMNSDNQIIQFFDDGSNFGGGGTIGVSSTDDLSSGGLWIPSASQNYPYNVALYNGYLFYTQGGTYGSLESVSESSLSELTQGNWAVSSNQDIVSFYSINGKQFAEIQNVAAAPYTVENITATSTGYSTNNDYAYMAEWGGVYPVSIEISWLRTVSYPPNGVMPTYKIS